MKPDITTALINKHSNRGGWNTFPFIIGSIFSLTVSSGGWVGNLVVYLITKYNVKSIDATQVNNVVLGCLSLFPIAGAIISDSFYGSFPVIVFFSIVSLMGVILMMLTSSLHSLTPPPCMNMSIACKSPSKFQYGVLYMAIGLASIGIGGARFTMTTMGADQFDDSNDNNISWTVGFGICVASNLVGLILFLSGKNFYQRIKPKGSPFTSIARVIVAAVKKRRVSSRNHEYNYDINGASTTIPSDSFRFLNHGALKIEADVQKLNSWSLCSVQEVEDLKTLIRIMPLWSTGILLSALIGMLSNFTILQALTMDGHLFRTHFKIPAASYLFFNTIATSISLSILDRLIFPM